MRHCKVVLLGGPMPFEDLISWAIIPFFFVTLFVWSEQVFLSAYTKSDQETLALHPPADTRVASLLLKHVRNLIAFSPLVAWAFWYQHRSDDLLEPALRSPAPLFDGLPFTRYPSYFIYLYVGTIIPYFSLRFSFRSINSRAFTFSFITLMLVDFMWEVTFALGRGYWRYHERAMIGISIPHWNNIPIEAVSFWPGSTVMVPFYNLVKLFLLRQQQDPKKSA